MPLFLTQGTTENKTVADGLAQYMRTTPATSARSWARGSTCAARSSAVPNSNVVVDVYDLNSKGVGALVTRQGHLIRQSGTIGMDLWSMDWKLAKGHRIAVRVTDANRPVRDQHAPGEAAAVQALSAACR